MNLIFSALQVLYYLAVGASASPKCRCMPSQSCWPSDSDFTQLASQVSQPLLQPKPPAEACYPISSPSGNCSEVQQNQFNASWRSDQPGSMQAPNFESYIFDNGTISACYLNTSLGIPCEQGSVPLVGVDARSVADVQAAVKFAVKHNLRLAVKNTGHDYLGRSTARNSFMIWTHHLKDITYNASFVPEGAPPKETYDAITLGSGVQWHEAYNVAQAHNRTVVSGISAGGTVGAAGGWILGGGHSTLSPRHGLGVDNAIQFTIVTSNGDHLTVNAHQHSDLFWALRGGGGGTYGVLTSVTYRTHQDVHLTGIIFAANASTPQTFQKLFTEFVRIHPHLSDAGFSGYAFTSKTGMLIAYMALDVSQTETNKTIDPFFAFAQNLTSEGLEILTASTKPYDSFYGWISDIVNSDQQVLQVGGSIVELASRLLPRETFEHDYERLADAVSNTGGVAWHLVAGGAVSKVDPDSTGLNPAWRKTLVHIAWGIGWDEGTSASEIDKIRQGLAGTLKVVSNVTPGSGAYFNEASMFEPDPKYTFFGSHYQRLKQIKEKYDPYSLFIVREGVGSEDWDESLNCRK